MPRKGAVATTKMARSSKAAPTVLEFEHEVGEFVRSLPLEATASERALATQRAFGAERAWSAAKVNAFFAWRLRIRQRGRPGFFDRFPDIGAFVRDRMALRSLDELLADVAAAFPGRRQPSRSAIGRYTLEERQEAVAAETREQLAKRRERGPRA